MTKFKTAWVLTGDGINCEIETASACRKAGFETTILHLAELVVKPRTLEGCSLLVIPGGFSFGDELGSGRVLALKLRFQLGWNLSEFAAAGGLVLGICNGFQTLVALGVFGDGVALAPNLSGRFMNEWTRLAVDPSAWTISPFLAGIDALELPIRHGEGRLLFTDIETTPSSPAIRYDSNPNGSADSIAGLFDRSGRIFGLMPHPEGYQRASQHPGFFRDGGDPFAEGAGLALFRNAFESSRLISKENPI